MTRRTRKQKEKARLKFAWEGASARLVKGQTEISPDTLGRQAPNAEKSKELAKVVDLSLYKRDLLKSLVVAGLILGTEVVLYLAWR